MARLGFFGRLAIIGLPAQGKAREKRKALALVMRSLRRDRPKLFEPVFCRLTPAFGAALADLGKILSAFSPVYSRMMAGDEASRGQTAFALAKVILKAKAVDPAGLTFDAMAEIYLKEGKGGLRRMDEAFRDGMAVFSGTDFRDWSRGYGMNRRIAELAALDLDAMLARFRPKRESPGRESLSACAGDPLVEGLLDLYFLLAEFRVDSAAESALLALGELSGCERASVETARLALQKLGALVSGALQPHRLGEIIRCIKADPEFELRAAPIDRGELEAVPRLLVENYRRKRHDYLHAQVEKEYQARLVALFGESPLSTVKGYDAEASARLFAAGLSEFRYMAPLGIIKTFFKAFHRPFVHDALASLSVEADFTDDLFEKEFRDAVESFEALEGRVETFEEELFPGSMARLRPILEQIEKAFVDTTTRASGRKIAEDINANADRIVQDAFSRLTALNVALLRIQVDARAKNPSLLFNAPFLRSKKPRVFQDLDSSVELVAKALGLLRMFAVDMDSARKNLGLA